MIISGGSRSNWQFFARHLMNARDNAHVEIAEIRGLTADNVPEALREMDAIASGTRCKNSFYHANLNTRADEHLTAEQWEQAVDTLERNLGLEGHARFVIEHTKEDRTHRHVVWSRIDPDTMTATSDSHNFRTHEQTSRELEELFGHEPVASTLTRDNDIKRPDRRPDNWETFRGKRSGIDPQDVKKEVTALWNASDSGSAFASALEAEGYILCRGDKRDFCIIDASGDEHSLARRIDGVKAAAVRTRMADIDPAILPSVAEGRELAKTHLQALDEHLRAEEEKARRAQEEAAAKSAVSPDTTSQPIDPNAQPDEIADATSDPDIARSGWELLGDYVGTGDTADGPPTPLWELDQIEAGTTTADHAQDDPRDPLDAYTASMEEALRHGEDIPARDGLTWFGRLQLMVSQTAEVVIDWAREKWDSFVAMVQDRRDDGPAEPDSSEPDVGK